MNCNRCPLLFLLAAVCLLALPASAAAAPTNDNFADATEMTGLPAEATGSNVDATRELGEPSHGNSNGAHSIWFRWEAPKDVGVTLRLEGCAPPFTNSSQASFTAAVYEQTQAFGLVSTGQSFRAVEGQVYYVAIDTPRGQPTDPDICIRLLPGPPNDDFAAATPLAGFPVSASQRVAGNQGSSSREPGEPTHEGSSTSYGPPSGFTTESVWYSWTSPVNGRVRVRLCGGYGVLGVYRGDRVDALTRLATRHALDRRCGSLAGGSVTLSATEGTTYRIAVTSSGPFQLYVENQVTMSFAGGRPFFLYTAFPGQADHVKLRLAGTGAGRALLVDAAGVTAANGCQPDGSSGRLRCPVPGKRAIGFDIDLRDGDDSADVRLPGRGTSWGDIAPYRRVDGGAGNDTLTGSAGFYSVLSGWNRPVTLLGGPGADRLRGAWGHDLLRGGAGPDQISGGAGSDNVDAGQGDDRLLGIDNATDRVRCGEGRDRARLDGFDLSNDCERRDLGSPVRATAIDASISNGDGEDLDHLAIHVACPIDAKHGCRARVTAPVGARRSTNRSIRLRPGRSDWVSDYSLSNGAMDRLLSRGIRVTVTTRRRSGANVRHTRHLPVFDSRYEGE